MTTRFMDREFLAQPPELERVGTRITKPGQKQRFHVAHSWSLNVYDYASEVDCGDGVLQYHAGCVLLMPPDTTRRFTFYQRGQHRTAHFRLPHVDHAGMKSVLIDCSPHQAEVTAHFDQALACHRFWPRRAQVAVWEILFILHDALEKTLPVRSGRMHPTVHRACAFIEQHLSEQLKISELAEDLGISHNRLTTHFREAFGVTVIAYVRRRRAELAAHLLVDTDMPIKAIAHETGMADLQKFNKTIRLELGVSPRKYRQQAHGS